MSAPHQPFIKWYPTDWRADPRLRMCSLAARGLWIELIGYMHEGEPYGFLTINGVPPSGEDIAALVGRPLAETRKAMAELTKRQVFSISDDKMFSRRMVRDKVKADRDRSNGKGGGNPRLMGNLNGGVNPQDKAHIPEARSQKPTPESKTPRAPALDDDWPEDFGDLFWKAYPRKTEKLAAMKKLAIVRRSGAVTFVDLMAGVQRYAAAANDPQYTKHPTSWLNAGCWADEIQTGGLNGNRTGNQKTSGHDAILAVANRKARELDRHDDMARPADAAGFAFGDGANGSGPRGNSGAAGSDRSDHQRLEPDDKRIREGEIIPPDKNAAGVPSGREFI